MAKQPIFVVTHPRACSTAFERVFMTRRDELICMHEPFGDPAYYSKERLFGRFADNDDACLASGHQNTTYGDVFQEVFRLGNEASKLDTYRRQTVDRSATIMIEIIDQRQHSKTVLIKDMANTLVPLSGSRVKTADSLQKLVLAQPPSSDDRVLKPELSNPTIVPFEILKHFRFAFLIRHPRRSIPSYYRCTIPPLSRLTGWNTFLPEEAGYRELRIFFDYLRNSGLISDETQTNKICMIDADDLLDHPSEVIEAFCKKLGLSFDETMLKWSDEDLKLAQKAFEKWRGFHEDALQANELKPRQHAKVVPSVDQENNDWALKFGDAAARVIRETVDQNVADYEYLKRYCLKVTSSS